MKFRETLQDLLMDNPDGLTIPQLMAMTGKANAMIRMTMMRTKGFYIADWIDTGTVGARPALWKWSENPPRDKPRPMSKAETGEKAKYHRDYTAQWRQTRAIQTTIRGPWPAH